jgi:uncharacterized protein (DUF697 family)
MALRSRDRWCSSALVGQDLAAEYLRDESYASHRERIDALINWETSKNFTSGFVTGLGGLLTLPFALPAGFAASWVIQARMAAAIARIYGQDLRPSVCARSIVATLVGDSIAEIATASGIRVGSGVAKAVADRVSRRGLIEFSRRVGSRLLRMAGQKSSVNLMKGVPLIGGIAAGLWTQSGVASSGSTLASCSKRRKTPPRQRNVRREARILDATALQRRRRSPTEQRRSLQARRPSVVTSHRAARNHQARSRPPRKAKARSERQLRRNRWHH